nr:uncharacterized protein LOC129163959 [Nothobranchius furzeri]
MSETFKQFDVVPSYNTYRCGESVALCGVSLKSVVLVKAFGTLTSLCQHLFNFTPPKICKCCKAFSTGYWDDTGDTPAHTCFILDGAVDLLEEGMKQSVHGLFVTLNPSSVPSSLHLSNSCLTLTYSGRSPPSSCPENKSGRPAGSADSASLPHVCADVVIARGQYYWEVGVRNSSVYWVGKDSPGLTGSVPVCSFLPEAFILI